MPAWEVLELSLTVHMGSGPAFWNMGGTAGAAPLPRGRRQPAADCREDPPDRALREVPVGEWAIIGERVDAQWLAWVKASRTLLRGWGWSMTTSWPSIPGDGRTDTPWGAFAAKLIRLVRSRIAISP
jgi:hypothetical protein